MKEGRWGGGGGSWLAGFPFYFWVNVKVSAITTLLNCGQHGILFCLSLSIVNDQPCCCRGSDIYSVGGWGGVGGGSLVPCLDQVNLKNVANKECFLMAI